MDIVVALVLSALSLLHIYWGFAGGIGSASFTVPERDGKPLFQPRPIDCLAVALALAVAAFLVLSGAGRVASPLPAAWTTAGVCVVGVVFLLRAIGDFRFVGFFKRVRDTPFGYWDTRVFSPLCLFLGAATLWTALA